MTESVAGASHPVPSTPPTSARGSRSRRRAVVVFAIVALVVVGAVLFGRWLVYRLSHSITGDAFVESDMINLAPQVPGEIVEMLVQDNQRVSKGERLCRIDPTIFLRDVETATANREVAAADLQVNVTALQSLGRRVPEQIARAEQELAVARNEQGAAEQALARIRETVAHEIARAEHDLAAAKANLEFADITLKRYNALVEGRAVGKEERDAKKAAYATNLALHEDAKVKLAQAHTNRKQIEIAEQTFEAAVNKVRQVAATLEITRVGLVDVDEARRRVDVAAQKIELARRELARRQALLAYTEVLAPFDGVVVKRFRFKGDYATPGTAIFIMYESRNIYVTAHMPETELAGVGPGPPCRREGRRLQRALRRARPLGLRLHRRQVLAHPPQRVERRVHPRRPAGAHPHPGRRARSAVARAAPGTLGHRLRLPRQDRRNAAAVHFSRHPAAMTRASRPRDRLGRGRSQAGLIACVSMWVIASRARRAGANGADRMAPASPPTGPTHRRAPRFGATTAGLVVGLALAACSMAPEYTRPDVDAPRDWRVPAEGPGSLADLPWWELFRDRELQELIRTGLTESKDVRIAAARIAQARASWAVTRSRLLPQVGTGASVIPERLSQVGFPLGLSKTSERLDDPHITLSEIGLGISFDLDLWGKLRSASDAARAELLASEEARQAVVVMLVGDVAQLYFDLRELDLELDITKATRESRIETLRIVKLRQEHGLVSDLDVRQAEIQVDTTEAIIPDLERRIAQTENRLSVFLGLNPGPIRRGLSLTAETVPPEIPAGLPSALLERRPDLRQAERQIAAANFRIGEARAAFFPNILLTGALGVQSLSLSDLFISSARFWQVGPTITLPLYTGGRLEGQLSLARARNEETLVRYAQAVQQAFREVNDALVANQQIQRVLAVLERQLVAARDAMQLAELRYLNGLTNYLDVLEAQRVVFTSEVELVRARRDRLVAVVQVYKALGGGWNAADQP